MSDMSLVQFNTPQIIISVITIPWMIYMVWAYGKPWTLSKTDNYPLMWGFKQLGIFIVTLCILAKILKAIF